jgi:hypothetical protein
METAIHVVWWIGLIGALVPTLIILKEAALVIRTLRQIHRLALLTRDAGRGLARHVAVGDALKDLQGPAGQLPPVAKRLAAVTGSIERKLAQLSGLERR